MQDYVSRGYLIDDYRLFHIRDRLSLNEIDYHYHEFHKALMFVGGNAAYVIEGKHYLLSPFDVVLVPRGCVHKPEVGLAAPYERYVLYLSPAFLRSVAGCDLETCFIEADAAYSHVLRADPAKREKIAALFSSIEEAGGGGEFGGELLARLHVFELLIELGRLALAPGGKRESAVYDEKIVEILSWINDNLLSEISIDGLAAKFYISKYHMMRRFRAETGYSIHSYITNKRLLLARDLLLGGAAAAEACLGCGYGDYSAFSRAYKKQFGVPPSQTLR